MKGKLVDLIAALADKQEINDLVVRYSTALDTRDWKLLETCFIADPVFDADGFPPINDFQSIRDSASHALAGLDASQHYVTNIAIELDGDKASVVSYLQAQHVRSSAVGGPNLIVAGIYTDDVVRTPDGWRFSHRRLKVTWTEGNPAVPVGHVAGSEA
jgi:SnoaL-like domain